jgi:hypothetical protein
LLTRSIALPLVVHWLRAQVRDRLFKQHCTILLWLTHMHTKNFRRNDTA